MFAALASRPQTLQPLPAKVVVRRSHAAGCDDDSDLEDKLKESTMANWPCRREFVVVVAAVVGGRGVLR